MAHLTPQQHAQLNGQRKWKMKQKLLAIGYTMQWAAPRSAEEVVMPRWQVCKNRIDAFMKDRGVVKKAIDEMSDKELSKAITQLQNIAKDFLKKI
jgi:hypothetical protein